MKVETLKRFLSNPAYKDGGIIYTKERIKVTAAGISRGYLLGKACAYPFKTWKIIDDSIIDIGSQAFEIKHIKAIGKRTRTHRIGERLSTNLKPTTH